ASTGEHLQIVSDSVQAPDTADGRRPSRTTARFCAAAEDHVVLFYMIMHTHHLMARYIDWICSGRHHFKCSESMLYVSKLLTPSVT
ncbi:hypothetical protein BRADI_3g09733v3, partial [Brachypodium distachyon]